MLSGSNIWFQFPENADVGVSNCHSSSWVSTTLAKYLSGQLGSQLQSASWYGHFGGVCSFCLSLLCELIEFWKLGNNFLPSLIFALGILVSHIVIPRFIYNLASSAILLIMENMGNNSGMQTVVFLPPVMDAWLEYTWLLHLLPTMPVQPLWRQSSESRHIRFLLKWSRTNIPVKINPANY